MMVRMEVLLEVDNLDKAVAILMIIMSALVDVSVPVVGGAVTKEDSDGEETQNG